MSLALYAADYTEDTNKEEIINRKRQLFKRRIGATNKNISKKPSSKATSTLNAIHSNLEEVESEEKELMNFKPIEHPESSGVEKTKTRSGQEFREINNQNEEGFEGIFAQETEEGDENVYASQYYNQYVPPQHLNFQPENGNGKPDETSELDKKLNYLIELIEQQRGERTDHVTEEILLYGLVGVFVIYVVDSFVKIGKYKR